MIRLKVPKREADIAYNYCGSTIECWFKEMIIAILNDDTIILGKFNPSSAYMTSYDDSHTYPISQHSKLLNAYRRWLSDDLILGD